MAEDLSPLSSPRSDAPPGAPAATGGLASTAGTASGTMPEQHDPGHKLDQRLVMLLAVGIGVAVASNYYVQPLLATIRRSFGVSAGSAGLIVTAAQIGYAAGLLFLVPLGDLLERRRLVVVLSIVTVAGLVAAGLAPSIGALYLAAVVIGASSVVAQILVAFAASLAGDAERGRVVGSVMSGLLIGILLARTVSGYVAMWLGWRGVYFMAGGTVAAMAAVLYRSLPRYREPLDLTYPKVLSSVWSIFRDEPVLRRRSLYGGLSFGAFSILWTSLSFLLAGAPFHYGTGTIGLFGLAGASGAVMASVAGRLADRGHQVMMTVVTSVAIAASFGLLYLGRHQVVVLLVAIVLLDLGCQGLHITNQSEIYRLMPAARSRVNSSYMTSYFVGGTLGSVGSALTYGSYGWPGVCVLGAAFGTAALVVATGERRSTARRRSALDQLADPAQAAA